MHIVFFADTHLGFDFPIKPRIKRRRRGPDFFANFRRVLTYARQTKPDFVLHGGDLFFRARVPHKVVDMVYADLFDFAKTGIPIIIVPGNHERSILPVSLFLNHPDIFVFDKPTTLVFDLQRLKVVLGGFPCQRKTARDQFLSLLEVSGWHAHNADIKLLCLHQTIEGAQVGPSDYTFRQGKDVIPHGYLPPDAKAVLSGHIHRKQVLGDLTSMNLKHPPVIYPGSTERTSFAEKDEDKGFFDLEFTQSEKGEWVMDRLHFVELPARPMEDLYLHSSLNSENLEDYIRAKIEHMAPDSIVRLRCDPKLNPEIKSLVTNRYLRAILPESMNYQFSADFRQV